jgi:hypothetical protein
MKVKSVTIEKRSDNFPKVEMTVRVLWFWTRTYQSIKIKTKNREWWDAKGKPICDKKALKLSQLYNAFYVNNLKRITIINP